MAYMGALKAGATVSVLDPQYPPDRQQVLLDVARPRYLIYLQRALHDFGNPAQSVVDYITEKVTKKRVLTYHILEEQALRNRPNHPFLIFEGKSWTFKQFYDLVLHYAGWLHETHKVVSGEIVALDFSNSPPLSTSHVYSRLQGTL